MADKKTRAQKMAEQYGQKLESLEPNKPKVHENILTDEQTPEQIERLEKAKAKLRDFIDLI